MSAPTPRRRGKTPEAKVSAQVDRYLRDVGALPVRVNSGVMLLENRDGSKRAFRGAAAGTSDYLVCLPTGRFMAVEVKAEGGKATDAQLAFIERVRGLGGLGVVVSDVDRDLRPVIESELGIVAPGPKPPRSRLSAPAATPSRPAAPQLSDAEYDARFAEAEQAFKRELAQPGYAEQRFAEVAARLEQAAARQAEAAAWLERAPRKRPPPRRRHEPDELFD